eukprot:7058317-Pyramimonas_sp.AAC.1
MRGTPARAGVVSDLPLCRAQCHGFALGVLPQRLLLSCWQQATPFLGGLTSVIWGWCCSWLDG